MRPRDLSDHATYVAGRGDEEVARELGVDPDDLLTLASNENQLGPSPAAAEAIRTAADEANRYPKSSHVDLRQALADRWDVAAEQVWLANGGDGALDYIARATLDSGDRVLVPDPGFAYYGMSARFHHGRVATYPLLREADFAMTPDGVLSRYEGERVVYLTSPHSPTGSEIGVGAVEEIARLTDEETLVVVDEAYGEFTDAPSARTLLREREDVAVLRTFSKAYGLAGVRLGYALTPAAWADAYDRVNTPFAASEIACRAGLAALEDEEHLTDSVETVRWGREYLRSELAVPTWPSGGNFVLADVSDVPSHLTPGGAESPDREDATTASVVTDRLQERGVLVRDCTSFGLPECVRITCGTEGETRQAVQTFNEVLDRATPSGSDRA
jgi:histidinol-phosphate aminotransferase